MSRTVCVSLGCISVGMTLTGCATTPVQTAAGYASEGAHATYGAASTGAHAVYSTGGQVYMGVGQAAKKPFHDLNMMQDPIPVVLLRTESKPYDLVGVNSCERILNQVAELDLALGPDVDSPKDTGRNRVSRGADAAAVAALDAATDAAEHFLPMRSVIKRVSGATRYENHVKHAVLAGTVRRAFLKAIGMAHNCGWPASPLIFNTTDVAMASSAWTKPGDGAGLQMLAIATPAPLAVPAVVPGQAASPPARTMLASAKTPSGMAPSATTRVVTTSVQTETVQTMPVQTMPVQVVPVQVVPVQVLAARSAPTQTMPVRTVAVQTVAMKTAVSPPASLQTMTSASASASVLMPSMVKVSAAQTGESSATDAAPSSYYPAPSTYAPSMATSASFASSGPAAPWATLQH